MLLFFFLLLVLFSPSPRNEIDIDRDSLAEAIETIYDMFLTYYKSIDFLDFKQEI